MWNTPVCWESQKATSFLIMSSNKSKGGRTNWGGGGRIKNPSPPAWNYFRIYFPRLGVLLTLILTPRQKYITKATQCTGISTFLKIGKKKSTLTTNWSRMKNLALVTSRLSPGSRTAIHRASNDIIFNQRDMVKGINLPELSGGEYEPNSGKYSSSFLPSSIFAFSLSCLLRKRMIDTLRSQRLFQMLSNRFSDSCRRFCKHIPSQSVQNCSKCQIFHVIRLRHAPLTVTSSSLITMLKLLQATTKMIAVTSVCAWEGGREGVRVSISTQ